jgi:multidrug efflux pump subunit AcrA (membrane-fusion protein)
MRKTPIFVLLALLFILPLSACDVFADADDGTGPIQGSGHIAARMVNVAPELSGKIVEISVAEGDTVQEGAVLIRLDDEIYQAQYNQAVAAVGVAEATVETAKAQLEVALVNYEMIVQGARFQEQPTRNLTWQLPQPDEFVLPGWYYEKDENLAAAETELEASEAKLEFELTNLENELAEASNADLIAVETRLAEARTAYLIAQQTLTEAQSARDNEKLEEIAQEELDAAESELDAAQLDYDRVLSTSAFDDVLDARGRVAIARSQYDNAQDYYDQFQTGDDSLQAQAALTAVQQAEAGVGQAKAAVQTLEVQIAKTVVYAPAFGVVLARNLEVGEVVGAGSSGLVVGELDEVELTVYIPEDRYGQVDLGREAIITVDSFPGEIFEGTVIRIADEAEFTPRNVQTVDGRKSTVYAVVVSIPNPDWKLKPGMPADAVIDVD